MTDEAKRETRIYDTTDEKWRSSLDGELEEVFVQYDLGANLSWELFRSKIAAIILKHCREKA